MFIILKGLIIVEFDENLIKITKYDVLGKLPNPFLMSDGSFANTPEKWQIQRQELLKTAVELQYGQILPKPEVFKVEALYADSWAPNQSYKITAGTKEKQVSFLMRVFMPKKQGKHPAIISGDLCFQYAFNEEYLKTFTDNNLYFVMFDRTELAHDIRTEGRGHGALYEVYPDYEFGAVMAWAWGYSRCVDALEIIGNADTDFIAFTGHSRGGKTAILAGALDERAKIVNPNEACAGGCGCYRIHMSAITEDGDEKCSETLNDIHGKFGFWFNEKLVDYRDCEQDLPFDSHYLKALIAPRTLFVSEAASDIWANPVGSWQTTMAAGEVYKMLGAEENLLWYYRKGYHYHKIEDVKMLVNIINNKRCGEELSDKFFKTPFKKPDLIFDWRAE